MNRFILSGGEPLVELDLLLHLLENGRARYPAARISIQTNGDPLWEALNRGDPAALSLEGFDRDHAERRIRELGSVCLWCDEFFQERAKRRGQDLELLPVMGADGRPDLV